jgi:hypothetical protein
MLLSGIRPAGARVVGLRGLAAVVAAGLLQACGGPLPEVTVLRAPEGGSLPQVVIDQAGALQLLYYTGSMSSGDLWHVSRSPEATAWSAPPPVNSVEHAVHGLGPIDGGQLAIGPDGVLHATWFQKDPTRFSYARMHDADAGRWGKQQTLSVKEEAGVESAPSVAVGDDGNVYVVWHADPGEEAHRRVYLTVSRDNGTSFDEPRAIGEASEGACGCCGLRTAVDRDGTVRVAYRGAGDNVRRGMRLLTSSDQGKSFTDQLIQSWEIGACPVATTTLSAGPDATFVAWETEGQIYVADVEALDAPFSPPGEVQFRRKNATVATNDRGDILLAWGDGPGWQSGGTLHWQLFDSSGRTRGEAGGGADPIPARSVPTIAVRADGSFVIVF